MENINFENVQSLLKSGKTPGEVFNYTGRFHEGWAIVGLNGKINYVDENSKLLSPNQWFDNGGCFQEGFACVELNGKDNFIDKSGNYLSNQWFDDCDGGFNEGFACVKLNGNWIFIDKNGNHYDENRKPLNENKKETIFDNKVFQDFLNYLDNATPEQLKEDWKQIEQLNKYGPLIGDLIKEALDRLDKNKEQDTIKYPEIDPLIYAPIPSIPGTPPHSIHIIPDGYGGFKYKPDYEVTTISTSSLKTKTEQ